MSQDWMITNDGQCQICAAPREWDLLETPYHFHRFLTQLEDVLRAATDECECMPAVRRLVRKLALNNYWLQTQAFEADNVSKVTIKTLYDEIGYPLTVQTNIYPPGIRSPIHNHGTWGVVTVLLGQEKNTFWCRTPTEAFPDQIRPIGEQIFDPGDVISFVPEAIHCVEAVGDHPLVTFNIYGETQHKMRYEFNPETHQAKNF